MNWKLNIPSINIKIKEMKRLIVVIILFIFFLPSCHKLDVAPPNIVNEQDIFTSQEGVTSFLSRLYYLMPTEDFSYSLNTGFNNIAIYRHTSAYTGEALSRDVTSAGYGANIWSDSYTTIRQCNLFFQTLPKYTSNFTQAEINQWTGEVKVIRAMTYFALATRYGGVPIVDGVLEYPGQPKEYYDIPRAAEADVYDYIAKDLDSAISILPDNLINYRWNKNSALALKSRVMLYAGSIAKYNNIVLFDNDKKQLTGIPASRANEYFKASFDAAKQIESKYSLYKQHWSAGDKEAQYKNFVNLFLDNSSKENIFVREYTYPGSAHSWDAYMVPLQLAGPNGWSSELAPTLNLVELYDGLPKNADSTFQYLDNNGKYILYNNLMDPFLNAEPRLRATVIFPGDEFKGEQIEVWRGIYTGSVANGINPLIPPGAMVPYPTTNLRTSANAGSQTVVTLPDGTRMNAAGRSGVFTATNIHTLSGFYIRKYLDPNLPTSQVLTGRSSQNWIEIRYAEVLLTKAEAAYELILSGQSGNNYQQEAFNAINQIRERAGANLLATVNDLNIQVIRKERRKELAFENKIWHDLRRWRIFHLEQSAKVYRVLMPFYASQAGKYFFDARFDQKSTPVSYSYDFRWYYLPISSTELERSPSLIQNPQW